MAGSPQGQTLKMEFLDGKNLYKHIREHGPLGEERAKPLARTLAASFHYMHLKGIVHRDIKTENIIVN